jgi:hypothetical protein
MPEQTPEITDTHIAPKADYWRILPAALALAGVILLIFATHGPPASSSGFVATIKGAVQPVAPQYVAEKEHYRTMPGPGSWLFAFVVGMAIGGFVAGRTWSQPVRDVPEIWVQRFGRQRLWRYLATFVGGVLILFGARLAGGCTLGLFISGSTQLAVSGLLFGVIIFAVSMLTARIVYGQAGREERHD